MPRSTPFTVVRLVGSRHASPRIDGPVLARVVQASPDRYVLELAGERLTIETQLPLKLRQRIELRPVQPDLAGDHSQLELRPAPAGALAFFAARAPSLKGSRETSVADLGSGRSESNMSQPRPATAPVQTGAPRTSSTAWGGDQTPALPRLPVPRRTDLICLREWSAGSPKPHSLQLPILGVESPALHSGEETVLRILESTEKGALAELKGLRVTVESPHPLVTGQELLCQVLRSGPSLTLRAFGLLPADGSTSRRASLERMESQAPFTIEVLERRLPRFPPEVEVAARVCQADRLEAVLTLGPVRIRVENTAGWQAGDRLHARVIQTTAAPAIELIPEEQHQSPAAEIRSGTVLTATVQRRIGPERFLIRVGSRKFEAATRAALVPDAKLSLRVDRGGRQPRVLILEQALPIEAAARQLLKAHLPALPPLDVALRNLTRHVRGLAIRPPGEQPEKLRPALARLQRFLKVNATFPPHAARLQELVRQSGLGFEKRLADSINDPARFLRISQEDLKGMLLEVADFRPEPDSPQWLAELRQSAEQVLGHLEVQQATNLLKSVSGEGIRLLIPFSLGSQFTTAQVEIRKNEGQHQAARPAKERSTTLLFLLDLQGLGKTRIDARIEMGGLQAHFFVEEAHSVPLLRSSLPDLARTLAKAGFRSVRLEAFPLDGTDPCPFDEPRDIINAEGESDMARIIDFRA